MIVFQSNKLTETCDHRPSIVSNRTVIPTNSDNWLFAKLSYPCDASRKYGAEQNYLISIVKQDGEKLNITINCDTDCTCQQTTRKNEQDLFSVKPVHENETLFFSVRYNAHKAKPGNYTVSLKLKNYILPCEFRNITIKSLFFLLLIDLK